jgi:hypothetical protein
MTPHALYKCIIDGLPSAKFGDPTPPATQPGHNRAAVFQSTCAPDLIPEVMFGALRMNALRVGVGSEHCDHGQRNGDFGCVGEHRIFPGFYVCSLKSKIFRFDR